MFQSGNYELKAVTSSQIGLLGNLYMSRGDPGEVSVECIEECDCSILWDFCFLLERKM